MLKIKIQKTIVESQIPMDHEYTAEEIGFDFYFHVIEIKDLGVRPVPEAEYRDYFRIEVEQYYDTENEEDLDFIQSEPIESGICTQEHRSSFVGLKATDGAILT